eukprot:scaffold56259_cov64-Phaeocystis_antarctica.AAC.1
MRKSCAAKADSCDGSAKVPVTRCMLAAVSRLGLGLTAAVTASISGSSLRRTEPRHSCSVHVMFEMFEMTLKGGVDT